METNMIVSRQTILASAISSRSVAVFLCGVLGLGILTLAGNVQAASLHNAAHDVRHANGFACH